MSVVVNCSADILGARNVVQGPDLKDSCGSQDVYLADYRLHSFDNINYHMSK